MNTAQLSAWAQKNKTTLMVVGAAGAVGLGLMQRGKSTPEEPAPNAGAMVSTSSGSPVPVAGYAAYDSSASDLYNAVQPGIEGLGQMLGELQRQQQKAPIPVPTTSEGFYREPSSGAIWQVDGQGNRDWLSPTEWAAFNQGGKVAPTAVARDSTFFKNTTPIGSQPKP